jgi:hypothetical protein
MPQAPTPQPFPSSLDKGFSRSGARSLATSAGDSGHSRPAHRL